MKIIAAFIMSAVLLGGCASFFESDKARFESECARHGQKYATPDMAQCVESKYQKREAYWHHRAEKRWEAELYLIE